jgi:hypothetical protein
MRWCRRTGQLRFPTRFRGLVSRSWSRGGLRPVLLIILNTTCSSQIGPKINTTATIVTSILLQITNWRWVLNERSHTHTRGGPGEHRCRRIQMPMRRGLNRVNIRKIAIITATTRSPETTWNRHWSDSTIVQRLSNVNSRTRRLTLRLQPSRTIVSNNRRHSQRLYFIPCQDIFWMRWQSRYRLR